LADYRPKDVARMSQALVDASFDESEQGPVIEFWEGDALCIGLKLLVFIKFGHKRIR
jgi:hypothetical protein